MYFADSKAVWEADLKKSILSQNTVAKKKSSSFAGQQRMSNLKAKATLIFFFISFHFIGVVSVSYLNFGLGLDFIFVGWLVWFHFSGVCGIYHMLGAP